MKKNLLFIAILSFFWLAVQGQNAYVNEIHYDNAGTDANEFVEVVVENPGTYALSDFAVVLYNGNGGASYDTKTLDVFTVGNTSGNFTFYTYVYPSNGIQNGPPDGFALTYQGTVISGQFLSYEGTFTATSGPANGMTSVDIGVAELGTDAVGLSLQLSGTATAYSGFTWNAPATETPGALNNNQTFGTPATAARIVGSMQGWNTTDPAYVMSENANGLYELTKSLNTGDWEYKVLEGDAWGDEEYPSFNQHVILSGTEDVTWKANINANLVTHLLPVVAGDFVSELGGNDWDPSDLIGEMEDPDGDDIYTLELLIPTAGNFACKVTLNHNWDQSTGSNVSFTTDGINTTVFTYDFPNNTTTVTGPPPPTATVTFEVNDSGGKNYSGFFLKGSWDVTGYYDASWGNGMEHSAFYDDGTHGDVTAGDHIWTCQQDLVVDNGANTWEWGVNDADHNWIAGNWQFTVPDENPQTLSWIVPDQPALIINEIMYNSPGTDEEWIELYNNTEQTIDLENWRIVDSDISHPAIVIPSGYSIGPGEYFTIEVATGGAFPFTPDYDGSGKFALNNTDDVVRLWNADNILVDYVHYYDTDPWPTEPDGNGPTLSLIDPDSDNSLASSWAASLEDGGTPGVINFPPIPFITVVYPNGGEYFVKGQQYEISWVYGYWDNDIKIELLQEGFEPQLIKTNIAVSQNSVFWTVWENLEVDTTYRIRISSLDPDEPSDDSDADFSIIDPYTIPNIVITEIMYNPPESGNDSLEFVELYNNSLDTLNLQGCYFSKGIEFVFPSVEILPDTFLLIAINSAAMTSTFGVQSLQWTSGALSNGGEDLELKDPFDNVIDFVPYDDALPWDTMADGRGPSLTLCDPDANNALAYSWTASQFFAAINAAGDSIFATPGFECSIAFLGDFEADNTIVLVGNGVNFTDQTIGDPISWFWTFEGGTPGTFEGQTPPEIIYDTEGTWDVTLEVSDGTITDVVTYTDYIWSGYAPVADFHADETEILVGTYANFFSDAIGDDLSFAWYFEGATPDTSNDENPTEIYYLIMEYETYDVTLIVSNPFGSDTMTREDYITTWPESTPDKISDNNIRLYPNPNNGLFTLALPAGTEAEVVVLDITGRPVFKQQMSTGKIDLTGLQKGLYLVKLKEIVSGNIFVKRLVVR
ncbi:MAG TPA: lamin tail domain-containing protein [Bacteroidales bacterium]